jgi:RsmE family RNA methyltransferase
MNICLFTPEEIGNPLSPHDERTEHIIKVLHKKCGDTFSAGIIGGAEGTAVITAIGPKGSPEAGRLFFTFTPEQDGKPLYPVSLIIGFPRPIQLKRLLRDVSGLGIQAVYLTGTELGEKSYLKSSLVERGSAYKMLLDGTAQAAGTHIPELKVYENLSECLDSVLQKDALCTAPDNRNPVMSITEFFRKKPPVDADGTLRPVVAAIGSERGWTDRERVLLEQKGFTRCGMGIRILRTETAATVAATVILSAMKII